MEEPTYEHDCEACIFLGVDGPQEGERLVNAVDMYAHASLHGGVTLIRRYSSIGYDYASTNTRYGTLDSRYKENLKRLKDHADISSIL